MIDNIPDDPYYNGPLMGYTTEEMAEQLGYAMLQFMDEHGMQIIWKRKDNE